MMRILTRVAVCLMAALLVPALSGCNQTTFVQSDYFVEAADLAELMQDPSTVVIDARSDEAFSKGHLQGAVHLPPALLSISEPVGGMLAPQEQVEQILGEKGIERNSKVYIYDNNGGVFAGRVWWAMKIYGHDVVKVVNGGETAIVASGLPLTLDMSAVAPKEYKADTMDSSLIATLEEVQGVTEGIVSAKLLDVRSRAEFDEGAIPGAILYPHTRNLYSDGSFKSGRDTWLDYNDLGFKRDEPIILYCKTSFRATQTMMVMMEAGFTNLRIYDGAWEEWSIKDMPQEAPAEDTTPSVQDAS